MMDQRSSVGQPEGRPHESGEHASQTQREDLTVEFLGQKMSADEYEASCKVLAEFFAILQSWREKEGRDATQDDE